jgi:mannonate dehydratase
MKMTWRWFGDADSVRLEQIAQIPCVRGIVGTIEDIPVGAVWTLERLLAYKAQVEAAGFTLDVIESIPVAEAIKLGLPERDSLIDAYCESIRNMGRAGIPILCYNFMPVFDWMRTEMIYNLPDASVVTRYVNAAMLAYDLSQGMETRVAWTKGFSGDEIQTALREYEQIDEEALLENFAYFLRRIVPVAEESGVYLALHPDDPPWSILGLPRIVCNAASIQRVLDVIDSPHHGLTFCTGSLGTLEENDLPAMVRQFAPRIRFVHMRNVLRTGAQDFYEVAHPTECGSVDMGAVMQALVEIGYSGPIRPDHGRRIWNEVVPRTGYGLYDRALGAMYLHGLYQGVLQARKAQTSSSGIENFGDMSQIGSLGK